MGQVFALNRNRDNSIMLREMMPEHPSAALIGAIEFTESEVQALHRKIHQREADKLK